MRYLIVDALLNGTGIRDSYNGGYLEAESLGLSLSLIKRINEWLSLYEKEHYNGYVNHVLIDELDKEGKEIAVLLKNELPESKVEYYSDARMIKEQI